MKTLNRTHHHFEHDYRLVVTIKPKDLEHLEQYVDVAMDCVRRAFLNDIRNDISAANREEAEAV